MLVGGLRGLYEVHYRSLIKFLERRFSILDFSLESLDGRCQWSINWGGFDWVKYPFFHHYQIRCEQARHLCLGTCFGEWKTLLIQLRPVSRYVFIVRPVKLNTYPHKKLR